MTAIRHEVIHLRRVSLKTGAIVTACTGVRIPPATRLRHANLPSGASCPTCLAMAAKEKAR